MSDARKAARTRTRLRIDPLGDRGMVAARPKCRSAVGDGELQTLIAEEDRRS
jgi:hypothetical protein